MDAVRYLEETRRMCRFFSHVACVGCPALINRQNCMFSDVIVNYGTKTTDAVAIVEKWSKEHKRKTRQSVFLSHYPNAEVDEDGVLKVCPTVVEGSGYMDSHKCGLVPCAVCHKAYWSVEVKEAE